MRSKVRAAIRHLLERVCGKNTRRQLRKKLREAIERTRGL